MHIFNTNLILAPWSLNNKRRPTDPTFPRHQYLTECCPWVNMTWALHIIRPIKMHTTWIMTTNSQYFVVIVITSHRRSPVSSTSFGEGAWRCQRRKSVLGGEAEVGGSRVLSPPSISFGPVVTSTREGWRLNEASFLLRGIHPHSVSKPLKMVDRNTRAHKLNDILLSTYTRAS